MLNNEYPPLGGGTGTVNEAILRELAREPEFEIDLVTSSPDHRFEEGCLFDRFRIFRLPVNRFHIHHASNGELARYAWRGFWFARRLHRERPYDLCMAWSAVPAGGAALALRRTEGLPYIVRVTGPDIPGFERRYARLYPVLKPLIRAIWRGARAVVAKCREEAEMIAAVDPGIEAVLIPNGVDAGRFQVERPPYEGPLRVLCVGRLIERKGQRDLIEAVRRLKERGIEVRCRLVGAGDAEADYRALVAAYGLEERVEFSGYVPREAMPQVYAEADVFVLPSYNEGMSVAALEALAAGLPLVLSRVGGTAELVEEGVNGWTFEAGDVEALGEILSLTSNYLDHEKSNIRFTSMIFSWKDISRNYIDEFSEINNWPKDGTS